MGGSSRIGRGWQLAKRSWAVLRGDRSLMLFPLVAAVAIAATALLVAGPGVALMATDTAAPVAFALWAIALFLVTYAGVYCSVALAAAANLALDGRDTTLADGFSVARTRRGLIAKWALVQLTVGLVLNLLEAALAQSPLGRAVASVVSGLLSGAWSIVTFFVVPLLALEGTPPREALGRSGTLIRQRWGEGLVGAGAIFGVVFLLVMLPGIALGALGVALLGSAPAAGGALLAVGIALVAGGALISSTLNAIFRVALYRYATAGEVLAGFSRDQLEHAFRPRRGRL